MANVRSNTRMDKVKEFKGEIRLLTFNEITFDSRKAAIKDTLVCCCKGCAC